MRASSSATDGVVTVTLTGDLDVAGRVVADEEIRRVEAGAAGGLVIDLRGLTFLDSSGLEVINGADVRGREQRRRVSFMVDGADETIDVVLGATGVGRRLDIIG